MLDDLRKPFFILALVFLIIAVLLEMGSPMLINLQGAAKNSALGATSDGYGVFSLALLDALLTLTVGLMGVSLLLPERIHGRIQGVVTLIVSIIVLLAAIALLFLSITLVTVMLALLLAPPFGTIAYFVMYAEFDRDGAAAILSLAMLLKLGFAAFLVLAHQRFLENKGLVLLVLTSLLAGVIVSFLHGLVPGFMVSITDVIGAIIVAVLTLIWALIFTIGSIISVVKAIV